jgi:hypothetical protein
LETGKVGTRIMRRISNEEHINLPQKERKNRRKRTQLGLLKKHPKDTINGTRNIVS